MGTESALRGKEILVVEDNDDSREILSACLVDSGATVRVAPNGLKALVELVSWTPDAIVTDLTMPMFDGFEFVRAVRSNQASCKVPVIAVTANWMNLSGDHDTVFDGILRKPLDYDALEQLILKLVS